MRKNIIDRNLVCVMKLIKNNKAYIKYKNT